MFGNFFKKNNQCQRLFLALFLLTSFINAFANQERKILNVRGEFIFNTNSNISVKEAYNKAIENAKLNALRQAGVKEYIGGKEYLSTNLTDDDKYKQLYSSISTSEMNGEILECKTVWDTLIKIDKYNYKKEVVVDATVVIYDEKADESFTFNVEGINSFYKNNEPLVFSLTPSQDCYFTLFLLGEDKTDVSMLYPNLYEKNIKLAKGIKQEFPINKQLEYALFSKEKIEKNSLILMISKKEIIFHEPKNIDDVIKNIFTISPSSRSARFFDIQIENKNKEK